MKTKEFRFQSDDGEELHIYKWSPDTDNVKAIIQISHGMAEHAARYERFAEALTKEGFVVYANDHRGHGKTAGNLNKVGFFAKKDGWNQVVREMFKLTLISKNEYIGVPVILLGHSMGSLLSREYITNHGHEINGVILTGTAGNPGALGKTGVNLARMISLFFGKRSKSKLLNHLSFGKFNKEFKPNRTDFDWLSRDNAEVDKYVNDPYCGGIFSAGFFYDFLRGIIDLYDEDKLEEVPKTLPVLLLSGEKDPVGNNGKGVTETYNIYKKIGLLDVSMKLYKDSRHEILNETNREEVFKDIIEWIKTKI
jgi:alpha-beta hydrolase superfamily lysophospholipase